MTPEVGKFYKTGNGSKAFVGFIMPDTGAIHGYIEAHEKYHACIWQKDGKGPWSGGVGIELIEEWKELRSGVAYVNIYPNKPDGVYGWSHNSRKIADEHRMSGPDRLACIRVPWTEGQFDD